MIRLKGRPDLVIISKPVDGEEVYLHNRVYVHIAIEIKKSLSIAEFSSSYREAERHLLGLCAYNRFSSPLVLLTDLNMVHSVLYMKATPNPLKFTVVTRRFEEFHVAMQFCLNQKPDQTTPALEDFGRAATPVTEDSE
mmetsp:Transcript_41619/g.81327  ORF Transcript_41619/g.81327 Transcript_41619/m.81327 type:complete len:138 (+) Transcript_41619:605-1018(+)